ncbi:hypothetical protein Ancab_005733 [Ancistrocladus abbreviatus]
MALASKGKKLPLSITRCLSLLQRYANTQSIAKLQQLHAHIITSGLFYLSFHEHHSIRLSCELVLSYAACGISREAQKLFDELPEPKLSLYNAMIRMYSGNGSPQQVLKLFTHMISVRQLCPDNFTYPFVIKSCGDMSLLKVGVLVHGKAIRGGFGGNMYVVNALLAMYINCGQMDVARWVFNTMRERNVVSWNTMISGCVRNGCPDEAVVTFNWMMDSGVELDSATVVSVLPAFGHLKKLELGRWLHGVIEEKGLGNNISVWNSVVDMYAKCGSMEEAHGVFGKMTQRDVVTWTIMINGYISNGNEKSALQLLLPMQLEGIKPNAVTIASLISACATLGALKQAMCLHGWTIRQKLDDDVLVKTALVDLYAKCNHLGLSLRLFNIALESRTAPWNAVLSGCVHNGLTADAIKHFKQMLYKAVDFDGATFNCLLPAYANLADLQQAYNIHGYLLSSGFVWMNEVITGLVHIYSKCGDLDSAHKIFNEIPVKYKDIVIWSTLIAGYGDNGDGEAALSLFKQMVQSGVKPNEVTFTSVLHSCSHAGLVDEGLDLFKLMLKQHNSILNTDHFTCMVDLLGRVGRLEEAHELINAMPFQPNHAVWGALLGACVIHEDVELGEVAARKLFNIEPENPGNYVLLAKIYAAVGRWEDAETMRSMLDDIGLRKTPAHSSIEAKNI